MKYLLYLFITFLMLAFCLRVSGQAASAEASATATIVETIQVNNARDLNFGNILAGETEGLVILEPSAASTRTATGGVTLTPGISTVQSAKFIVSGTEGNPFTIILPSSVTIYNGPHSMLIDNFTSMPSGSGIFGPGSQSIYVGATLHINANQESGIYKTIEDFKIFINYN